MQTGLTKATIINLDKKNNSEYVDCLFNPNEYTFQKRNNWAREQTAGASVPQLEFGGGLPATLQMKLFFDTLHDNKSGQPIDVRKSHTDKLWQLMMVDEALKDPKNQKGRPPRVRFQWGRTWSFDAVILSMSQRFTLFAGDGTPVRATVEITFQQIKDEKRLAPQNPTSGGTGGERIWTVRDGDRLPDISYSVYGNATRWRAIADENGLEDVRDIRPGMRLLIPRL